MVYITDLDNPDMYGYTGYRTPRRHIWYRRRAGDRGLDGMCDECGPNTLPVVIFLILFIIFAAFVPAFVTPYWATYSSGPPQDFVGLWQACADADTADAVDPVCVNLVDGDGVSVPDFLRATQVLMSIGLGLLILGTLVNLYWVCSDSRYYCLKVIIFIHFLLAFVCSLTGVVVFGAEALDNADFINTDGGFAWGFYLVCVATALMVFPPVLLVWIPSIETYPGDFGFGGGEMGHYPRPMHMGPPPPNMYGANYGHPVTMSPYGGYGQGMIRLNAAPYW